jgi:hypothetical protein
MDAVLLYALIGAGAVLVVLVAIYRPGWLKYALLGFGILAGAGVVSTLLARQRRLRQIGLAEDQAGAIARLTVRAEQLNQPVADAAGAAYRDVQLRLVQADLQDQLTKIRKEGKDANAVLAEIRLTWPGF